MEKQYLYDDITQSLWKCYSSLYKKFAANSGYTQANLVSSLQQKLEEKKISVSHHVPVIIRDDEYRLVGWGPFDLVLDCRVAIAVYAKAKVDEAQFRLLMKSMGLAVGVILDFSAETEAEGYHRLYLPEFDPNKYKGR